MNVARERSKLVVLPSVRTYRLWTPAALRAAEISADSGNIREAVNICDWLLADEVLRGALDARATGFLGLPLTFEASGDGRRRNRAVKALEAGEDWDAIFRKSVSKQIMWWALLLGLGSGVNQWQIMEEQEGRDIPVLEFFHPQSLTFSWGNDGQARGWYRTLAGGQREPIVFGDGTWFGHMPFGTYRPWSLGQWRGLSRWALLKAYAISDSGRLGESVTKNVVEVDKEVEGGTPENRQALADELADLARDGSIVLPPGFTYKLVTADGAATGLWKMQVAMANEAFAIAIRGGNLSTSAGGSSGGSGGSRATAEVQERSGDLANRKEDAEAFGETAHDHSLVPWSERNYGTHSLAPWPKWKTEEEADAKLDAETMVTALDGASKALTLGFIVDPKAFAEKFGGGVLKPGPGALKAPAPAVPFQDPRQQNEDPADADDGERSKQPPPPRAPVGDDAPKPKPRASSLAVALASGSAVTEAPGFVDAQLYGDKLTEAHTAAAIVALTATRDAIFEALVEATSYEELRERLRAKYAELDADDLTQLVKSALQLGALAGRLGVQEDVRR